MKWILVAVMCCTLGAMERPVAAGSEISNQLPPKDFDPTVELKCSVDALEIAMLEYLRDLEAHIHEQRDQEFEQTRDEREQYRQLHTGVDLRRLHEKIAGYGDFLLARYLCNAR